MTTFDDLPDRVLSRADDLHARRCAAAEMMPSSGRTLGIYDLVTYLTQAGRTFSAAEKRELLSSAHLQADLRRLRGEMAVCAIPALAAAASAGDPAERSFQGGTLRIHPSKVGGQSYVVFQFRDRTLAPAAVTLEGAAGEHAKRALPRPDDQGRVLLVMDSARPDDAEFLRLASDPLSQGAFLR